MSEYINEKWDEMLNEAADLVANKVMSKKKAARLLIEKGVSGQYVEENFWEYLNSD